MGNCYPKPHKRGHFVEPTRTSTTKEEMNIDEILSKSANCHKQNDLADMVTALKVSETDENNAALESPVDVKKAVAFTVDLGDEAHVIAQVDTPTITKKALTFTVGLDEEKPKTKTPKQLTDTSETEKASAGEVAYTVDEESLMDEILREAGEKDAKVPGFKKKYTSEERGLMAEIIREDRLKDIKEKVRQEDVKRFDAKMRRAVAEKSKIAKVESKTASCAPIVDDKRKKVKDLAANDRRRAAKRREEE